MATDIYISLDETKILGESGASGVSPYVKGLVRIILSSLVIQDRRL